MLITLTVLGVIAALTVPSLVHKIQDRQQITAFKRAYSILSNAYDQMIVVYGSPDTWSWPEGSKNNFFAERLNEFLPVEKYCGSDSGCFLYGYNGDGSKFSSGWPMFKNLYGNTSYHSHAEYNQAGKTILKNGIRYSVSGTTSQPSSSHCFDVGNGWAKKHCGDMGIMRVDTNGVKGPNRFGYDVFYFSFKRDKGGLIPSYMSQEKSYCDKTDDTSLSGATCSQWVYKHNNMDYKYRDISSDWEYIDYYYDGTIRRVYK